MQTKTSALLLTAAIGGLMGAGSVAADTDLADAVRRGEAHYLFFCAHCHGAEADGNGPYARLLKIAPANLTLFGQAAVAERVLKAVDGRHEVGGGQEQKMPVFSENLEVKTVYQITEYLKTLQQ